MSSAGLGLALGAAVIHAFWNLLLAGSRDALAATAVALEASLVVAAPFAVATWGIEREAIPWLVASAALELVYFFTLLLATLRRPFSPAGRNGRAAPIFVERASISRRTMSATYERERTLQKQIEREVETALPGVEVLAVELSGPDRFTVFVDHANGVDHALCARVTDLLRDHLNEYAIDVSSPGIERPLRKPEHFRNAIGRKVTLRTPERKKLKGEVITAGEKSVVVQSGDDAVEIPYENIVRGNLVYTDSQ